MKRSKNGFKLNSGISVMWSAIPDAPLLIVMFVMFVVNGSANLRTDDLWNYTEQIVRFPYLENLCKASESLSKASENLSEVSEGLSEASKDLSEASDSLSEVFESLGTMEIQDR